MLRRILPIVLLLLACRPAAAQGPCWAGSLEVHGRVIDTSGGTVPCCGIFVHALSDGNETFEGDMTRADGSFVTCVTCTPPTSPPISVWVEALCCGTTSSTVTVASCDDIADVGDIHCTAPADTGQTLLEGNVACRNAPFLDPVADCSMLVRDWAAGTATVTYTDAAGDWSLCMPCSPTMVHDFEVTAQCCGQSYRQRDTSCPLRTTFPQFVCDPCPTPPCPAPRDVEISGYVYCRPDPLAPPVPLPGCDVNIRRVACGGSQINDVVTTDGSGRYVLCASCWLGSRACYDVTATSLCCRASTSRHVDGCEPRVVLDDMFCTETPPCTVPGPCSPDQTLVTGLVQCSIDANGDGLLDPIVGATVTIQPDCGLPVNALTDATGRYQACVQCLGCTVITASTSACSETARTNPPLDCSATQTLDITCTNCVPPPCGPSQILVEGTVRCDVDADGDGQNDPVPGCNVVIQSECPGGPSPVFASTDANGRYSACAPCSGCTSITTTASCCGASTTVGPPLDCTRTQTIDVLCIGCGRPPNPCAPDGVEVFGTVTCSRGGVPEPMGGCVVELRCIGSPDPPVTATTAADGTYSACFPCPGCPAILVTATCCGATRTVTPTGCYREQADIDCGGCAPPRPCPGPNPSVEARGMVVCSGSGRPSALAGCTVLLVASDGVITMTPVTTVTGGDGSYAACVPCPPGGLLTMQAQAQCCAGSSTTTFGGGCPERVTLQDVTCTDCAPCPAGMTRVEGRVHCRGGGGIEGCPVTIAVDACSGVQVFTAITDAEGRYRACVPCPCTSPFSSGITATATCCGGTRNVRPDRCGPVTPIPTIFCPAPCR